MKAEKFTVELLVNTGNYENFKVGGEFSLDPGEQMNDAMKRAYINLKKMAKALRELNVEQVSTDVKREELTPQSPKWARAKEALKAGRVTIDKLESAFDISEANKQLLTKQ